MKSKLNRNVRAIGPRWYRASVRFAGWLLVFGTVATSSASARAAPIRWPSWPSEVARTAAPVADADMGADDRERVTALVRLQRFPTPLIEDTLRLAVENDPSVQVVREALRICYLRRAEACLEPATALFREPGLSTLRAPALRVLATDPRGNRLDLLLGALLDPSDALRAEAAQLAGWAPVQGEARARTRRALLSKLSDSASAVRERAVTALGLQGPGEGTLTIAKLLEDPEPDVRAAAAVALGRLGDPKATAALLRALDGQDEANANVTRAVVFGLARLPGEDVVPALLRMLDDPPPGVGALTIAEAIGNRAHPEPPLIEGLVLRLRDTAVENAARRALLWMGDAAAPQLREALDRGMGPRQDAELRRLIGATEVPRASSVEDPWPTTDDHEGWHERLRVGPPRARLHAAAELGGRAPSWLPGAMQAELRRGSPEAARSWTLAFATMPRRVQFPDDAIVPWATLAQWSLDRAASGTDRCIAALALGRSATDDRATITMARDTLHTLLGASSPRLRACVVWAARDLAPEIAALGILDSDPRVRVAAIRAVGPQLGARRLQLATHDPSAEVRAAADAPPGEGPITIISEPRSVTSWAVRTDFIARDAGATPILGMQPTPWGIRRLSSSTPR